MENCRFILSVFAFCLTLSSNSQSVCYNFDDCVIDATNNTTLAATRNHAFNTFGNGNNGCLEDWEVTSGTPSLYRDVDGFGNAYNGTQYALIGVCGDFAPTEYSDGIALKYNFDAGQTYTVSMAVKTQLTTNPVDVDFLLLQNSLGYTYNSNIGCSATPGVPGSAVGVHSLQSYSSATWQTISFTVSNINSNFTRLWIRGVRTQTGSNHLMVDSVCIQPLVTEQATCYNFDDCVIDATNNTTLAATRNHAFNTFGNGNSGCLEDWEVTSGTPSLYRDVDGFGNAYNGTQYALIGVCGDFAPTEYSDGIALKYNFDAGQTYTVSMAVKTQLTTNPVDVDFLLLQNSLGYTYNSNIGCSATPGVPGSAVGVHSLQSYSSATWQTISFTVSNINSNFTRLWIRGVRTQTGSNHLMVDSVCITKQLINAVQNTGNEKPYLQCIPNPAASTAFIHYKATGITTQVLITDIAGRLIKGLDTDGQYSGSLSINTEDMFPGIYLCSLISEGKLLKTIKIIKE